MYNLKLSQFTIFSDPIINNEYIIAYSSYSNALILLKSNIIDSLKMNMFDKIDSDILENLISNDMVVPNEFDELKNLIEENKKSIHNSTTLNQVIQPSANCQLGCNYCGQVHTKDTIEKNLEDKIFKRIENNLKKKNYKSLNIGWFGGEPLMGLKNLKTLSFKLIDLARENNCAYSAKIVTNGMSLKPEIYYDLVYNHKLENFEITLDGTEEHHDLRRFTKKSGPSFSLIYKNLKGIINDERFDASKGRITIRCNVDSGNYKGVFDLIDLLDSDDILSKVRFYTAPIHSWGNDAHLKSLSTEEYASFQIEVLLRLQEKGINYGYLSKKRKKQVCISTGEHDEVFDAYGDVYDCTEISQVPAYEGKDEYKAGKLYDETYKSAKRTFGSWNDDILAKDFPCSTCEILPICGGSCPKLWKEGIVACPAIKHNIKDRMIMDFSLKLENAI
jgi:uncharacterized protein